MYQVSLDHRSCTETVSIQPDRVVWYHSAVGCRHTDLVSRIILIVYHRRYRKCIAYHRLVPIVCHVRSRSWTVPITYYTDHVSSTVPIVNHGLYRLRTVPIVCRDCLDRMSIVGRGFARSQPNPHRVSHPDCTILDRVSHPDRNLGSSFLYQHYYPDLYTTLNESY